MEQIPGLIVFGIIQGLTEFIPVSSSGHLQIIPAILGVDLPTNLIIAAHFGTLLSLLFYYRKKLLSGLKEIIKTRTLKPNKENKLLYLVLISSIPAGIIGYLSGDLINRFYDEAASSNNANLLTISALFIVGAIFIFNDKLFREKKIKVTNLKYLNAFSIGIFQVLALIRGVSRSGITLLAGQYFKLSRRDAAEFSFLMSIPLIAGVSLFGIVDIFSEPLITSDYIIGFITIVISSFVSGYFAIQFMISYLQKNNLAIFGWYRIILAIVSLLILFG